MSKILLIEDEDRIRASLKRILELSDFEVIVASNGAEGIAIAQQHMPDLVLCDIMMPEMSGYEVLQQLQENSPTDTIPFIFLTAKSGLTDIREGMELGADDYLTKPIKTETLLKCIRTRLDKKEQQRRQSESQLVTLRNNIARSIPHELNTPLNGIMGLAQLLGTVPDAEVQEWSGEILSSAMRLHTTINKFLVYTELELAIQVPQNSVFFTQVREVDISCLAIQVADGIANRCERTDDLQLDLQPSQIVISPFLGEKLLAELIDNAFKFSKPGTPVQVSSDGDQEEISLIVRDQGRGMNPAQIAQIGAYTQFERRIYEQQGLGLGLVIAKYTVELLGGSLTIYSPSMAGTTVEVKLPRQPKVLGSE